MRRFRAPGRVNLMGDHTDYHDGLVLPMAVDLEVVVEAERPAAEPMNALVRVASESLGGLVEVPADGTVEPPLVDPPWGRLVAGVIRALVRRGWPPTAVEIQVSSTLPVGSGLSSSAAFEVALAIALLDAAEVAWPSVEIALASQEAETLATGVPCGIMDQLASVAGVADHALVIDCRELTVAPVAVPNDIAVVVVHSGLPRTLEATPYATRRAESEADAAALGLRVLRDAGADEVASRPRARHVVSENARVEAMAGALATSDRQALARILAESHASLRDDYEVSTPELDALVDALVDAGALGARLTGAGFGGCVVALVDRDEAELIVDRARQEYRARVGREAWAHICRAVEGAGPVQSEGTP